MKKSIKYIPTGEVRPPRFDELFKGDRGNIVTARFDFTEQSFPIMIKRVIEIPDGHVECQGFLIDDDDPDSFSGCDWKPDCPVCHGSGHHMETVVTP